MLLVVPYYNKPGQAGMVVHFRSIAESVGLPIISHDIPSRTVCGLADETVVRLAEIPQLVGLKDASGDLARPLRLRARLGPDFCLTVRGAAGGVMPIAVDWRAAAVPTSSKPSQ